MTPPALGNEAKDTLDMFSLLDPSDIYFGIAAAKLGDVSSVGYLSFMIETEVGSRCLPEALDIYLSFLNPSLIPYASAILSGDSTALDHAERGLHSLMGLQNMLQRMYTSSQRPWSSSSSTRRWTIVAQRIEGIADWFRFALTPSSFAHPRVASGAGRVVYFELFCSFMVAAGSLSPSLKDAVWGTSKIQDLVVHVWLTRNGDINPSQLAELGECKADDYFLNGINGPNSSASFLHSTPALMESALGHEKGPQVMEKLYHQLGFDGQLLTDSHVRLANTVLSRIRQVQARSEGRRCSTLYAIKCLSSLCNVILALIGGNESDDVLLSKTQKTLYSSLYKAGYIELITRTLASISNRAFLLPKLRPDRLVTLRGRYRAMLQNGVLEAVANAAFVWEQAPASFRESHAEYQVNMTVVRALLFAALHAVCHPGLVCVTERAFDSFRRSAGTLHRSCLGEIGPVKRYIPDSPFDHWGPQFRSLVSQWKRLFSSFRTSWPRMRCDSQNHTYYLEHGSLSLSKRLVRTCAGCSAVVYCSTGCQKSDWQHRHRNQCFNRLELRQGAILKSSNSAKIARVELHRFPFKVNFLATDKYHPLALSSCRALDQSFRQDFLLWTPPPTIDHADGYRIHFRLVEGVFTFQMPDIVVLMTLKYDGFTAICMDSLVRIGSVEAL
ncbi:hypothetical protein BKA70DRAFT_1330538 [Coprinopsis sp. MPI-PUGE-AT-0042]|nr:hypothetical protein BKA70DRAFT_1330538 [Coprinopsis sp. MPI-PUGE-AT-0042]